MSTAHGYAAPSARAPLAPFQFERRPPGAKDVEIQILYCGICHTDIHLTRDEWGGSSFPMVPGHEIVGRVTAIGDAVQRFRPGDLAGVGCMVDSCRACASCREGLEQYCENGFTATYNGKDRTGQMTLGGYSDRIVVDEAFVLRIAHAEKDLPGVAPLLCAGITTYSPLRHWQAAPGAKVGVMGLGGLGHMAVKLAHAMGAQVVLFTHSPHKTADGRRLGADEVVIASDEAAVGRHQRSFDLILNTISAVQDLNPYLGLLKRDGALTLLGAPPQPLAVGVFPLIMGRRALAGSLIGGIAETQEMLDFCAARQVVSEVEVIPIQKVNEAYERMLRSDVKYRFVIDLASLGAPPR